MKQSGRNEEADADNGQQGDDSPPRLQDHGRKGCHEGANFSNGLSLEKSELTATGATSLFLHENGCC
jgi:hypothetical protein